MISTAVLKKLAWSFGRAFVASLVVGLAGITAVPSLSAAKALALAALTGAVTAGIRAAEQTLFGKKLTNS